MSTRVVPKRQVQLYLAEWREHRKLTQKQLAERLGCDVMTVSRWELHKIAVSTDTLAALAEALGEDVEPVDLFYHPNATLLRGRDLHPPPIETTRSNAQPVRTTQSVGGTNLDDMWTIWNTATREERQLIVDLARQVVGRLKK